MTSDRIKEIQQKTAYPNSVSVKQALLQVWNECAQEYEKLNKNNICVQSKQFTCKTCGEHEKQWSRKNNDWYCKTCGHICR